MILVICGTNRPNSNTSLVAKYTYEHIRSTNEKVEYFSMEDFASEFKPATMYNGTEMSQKLQDFQDNYFIPATKLIIVTPEYNGSFPGIFKTFVDVLSVRKKDDSFTGKKAVLVGVASGRAGNLRGMEHLTGLLNYLKVHVYPIKLPISLIESYIVEGQIDTKKMTPLHDLLQDFAKY